MVSYSKTIIPPPAISPTSVKILWISDLHFYTQDRLSNGHDYFLQLLSEQDFDCLIITGDISNASYLKRALVALSKAAGRRMVYFVLGNHDFHGSSFAMVDKAVAQICRQCPNLYHLGYGEVIELTTQVALIGHRGWPDGKAGYGRNTVSPHRDSKYIADFKGDSAEAVFSKMALLGEASGDYFRKMIPRALMHYQQLLVATHVPPFVWAAHTRKKVCHKKDLPFFTNISAGESIKQCLSSHPEKSLKVLCGHTHQANTYNETPALRVHVAAAKEMRLINL